MVRRFAAVAVLASLVAVLLSADRAPAAPPAGDEQELVARVNKAIGRGMQFLRVNHSPATQWDALWINAATNLKGGVTALAALALLNCGATPQDREVREALAYLRGVPNQMTYPVALSTMVFAEARQPQDIGRVQQNVDWLLKTAVYRNGKLAGWSYPSEGGHGTDGSNTQYALLGLYAGKQAGAKIHPKVWREIQEMYVSTQKPDGRDAGYWMYTETGPLTGPRLTMTVAGVAGLVIAGMGLDESQQRLDPKTGVAANCGAYDTNGPVAKGMNWIGRHFALANPQGSGAGYYNIYGIERVGRLSGQRFLGRVDWYREGCEFLVREQGPDGSWAQPGGLEGESAKVISTSFALLFLSKGRAPVLVSKLAHGEFVMPDPGTVTEKGPNPNVVGWNRKHNDARHLTEFASRELFDGLPLGWQSYDPRRKEFPREEDVLAEVGVLVQSPVLYFNGHERPVLTGQQKKILKRYVEEGGFVLAEACCGSPEFAAGFRDLMAELFPDSKLQKMPPEHGIWRASFAVPPDVFPRVETLDRGCRTVVVFSPEPMAGYWEESRFMAGKGRPAAAPADPAYRGEQAFRFAANVIAYATGMEPPKQRLSTKRIAVPGTVDRSPPKGFVKPAQLRIPGEAPPAPAAMRNLMTHLQTAARLDVVLDKESIAPADDELLKYKFVYMHGRKRFEFDAAEVENLKANLLSGGLLFADACCGKPEFDASFRELAKRLFPDGRLEVIPPDDELYSAKLNGTPVTAVKRREKPAAAGGEVGYQDLPPHLEGIKVDGRWVVIYSKYDVGCALEGHRSTDCLGHTRDSALQLGTAAMLYALKR